MKSSPIPSVLFKKNRAKLGGLMVPGSFALVGSNELMHRNGDQNFPFRQHSDFFYLTGINQEEGVLLLNPGDGKSEIQEILFIKKPTSKSVLWFGYGLTLEEASLQSGIVRVKWIEDMDTYLEELALTASTIYISGKVPSEKITEGSPDLKLSQLSPLMTQVRMKKEYEEVEEIKKASMITHEAFLRVLNMLRPGTWEYEVEAEITAEFIGCGAMGHAYDPILASGKNALILHYIKNNDRCKDGDLVLMDFGAEVNNYAADCSRTVPVNGRFSARQREVYEATLRVFRLARELMVPGTLINDFHKQVGLLWEEEHIRLGLYSRKDVRTQTPDEPLWKKYFMHGTSHSLGLDVHDPFDRTKPFEPGMVLTCEPAIYLPEEGFAVRLENDILITEIGPVDLTEDIPIEVEDIEALMHSNP